jgi:hypothetical protein
MGRFWTVDPGGVKAADPRNPTSWNRYAYTLGDPINMFDPTGTYPCGSQWASDSNGNIKVTVYDCSYGGGTGDGYHPPALSDSDQPNRGGSGTVPSSMLGLTAQQRDALMLAMTADLDNLTSPDCQGLFGTAASRANGFDPATLFTDIYESASSTIAGTLISTAFDILPANGPLGLTIGGIFGGVGSGAGAGIQVLINSDLMSGNDMWDLEITLLHELGHVYNLLPGSGGSQITRLGDVAGNNNDLIVSDCLQTKAK